MHSQVAGHLHLTHGADQLGIVDLCVVQASRQNGILQGQLLDLGGSLSQLGGHRRVLFSQLVNPTGDAEIYYQRDAKQTYDDCGDHREWPSPSANSARALASALAGSLAGSLDRRNLEIQ